MRAVVQRIRRVEVAVAGRIIGQVGLGLVAFVGVGEGDRAGDVTYLANKISGLRVFPDESGKMSRALADVGGGLLVVSQFTLYGDVRRGLRPSFDRAMLPDAAEGLYDSLVALLRSRVPQVSTGRFGADMQVTVENDGPVTLIIDSPSEAERPSR
jgi:D-tyrosyl-tRNA(Tyr) deacylase